LLQDESRIFYGFSHWAHDWPQPITPYDMALDIVYFESPDLVASIFDHWDNYELMNGVRYSARDSLLVTAVRQKNDGIVRLLLERGANIEAGDYRMRTPLMVAATKGYASTMQLLLDKGAKLGTTDRRGFTALHYAVRENQYDATRLLLDKGADLESRDEDGETPLDIMTSDLKLKLGLRAN
jgi:ankyrin repeat protein